MKEKSCCFTGHRLILEEDLFFVRERLGKAIKNLIMDGYTEFITGGALGFDTEVALVILGLRQQYPCIRLSLALPCKEQSKGWTSSEIAIYEEIKAQADEVVYVSETYTKGCMHKRNRYLVDHSIYCITYLNQNSGGTAYTVKYAIKQGRQVENIAPVNIVAP